MSSTTTTTPFTLSRASIEDIPELTRLMYKCFPLKVRECLMGIRESHYDQELAQFIAFLEDEYRTHHHAVWIKVVDNATGIIAAASLWKIYPNAGTPRDGGEKIMPWLDEERRALAEKYVGGMNQSRMEAMKDTGFVHLHICFTSPDYRRQGAGGLMMGWGCEAADILGVPAWIEASVEGAALYRVHGFVEVETPPGFGDGTFMRREVKGLGRVGGHVKV